MSSLIDDGTHPALAAVASIDAGLDELADARLWSMSTSEVRELVIALERIGRRVAHAQLAALGQADAAGVAAHTAAASTAAWLRAVADVPIRIARDRLQLHHDLGGRPLTNAALAAGAISVQAAGAVCQAMSELPAQVPAALLGEVEQILIDTAREEGTRAVVHRAADISHRFDPDLLAQREQKQRDQRFLTLTHQHDGTLSLRGRFDPEHAALLSAVLSPLAAPHAAVDGVPDLRDGGVRYADALIRLCQIATASADLPSVRGERPAITLTVALETLRGDLATAPGHYDTGAPLSAETARRLACDARIIPIVMGARSEPLDIGRANYVVPQPMRRALVARDHACAFPGCDRPPAWCDAHHLKPWSQGGHTALSNLVLLCGHHHDTLHHHGWQASLGDDHKPWFTPPPWIDPNRQPRQNHRYTTRKLRL